MPTPRKELRARHVLERRALTEAEKAEGYIGAIRSVIPYNSDSGEIRERGTNGGRPFVEQVARGAFKTSLDAPGDIMAFAGHTDDPLASLARAGAGLTFTETAEGLQWEALVPDTTACRDLIKLIDGGVIKGASFEFSVRGKDGEKWEKRGSVDVRIITDAALYAVNPVAWPAYEDSSLTVALRSRSGRGLYAYPTEDYSWNTPDDRDFAEAVLSERLNAFSFAQGYLRAHPTGAHAAFATAVVSAAPADVKAMLDWLAANGATPDEAIAARAREIAAEKRDKTPGGTPVSTFPDSASWAALHGI